MAKTSKQALDGFKFEAATTNLTILTSIIILVISLSFYFRTFGEIKYVMKNLWWKILAVLLLLYSFVGGLKTYYLLEFIKVEKSNISDSTISLVIIGYNTNFSSAKNIESWYFNADLDSNQNVCLLLLKF